MKPERSIDSPFVGLRERKKRATRAALANAAMRLADKHGLAHLRIEDIAAEAGVSLRTFRNYFPNKEAAVVGVLIDNSHAVIEALRERPDHEDIWEALAQASAKLYSASPDRAWIKRMALLRAEPSLSAEKYKSDAIALDILAAEIEARQGTRTPRIYPRLAAEVTFAAIRAAIEYWLDVPTAPSLKATVLKFMRQVRLG